MPTISYDTQAVLASVGRTHRCVVAEGGWGFAGVGAQDLCRPVQVPALGQQVFDVDMNDIIKRGQRDQAFRLQENDVVVVPESFF